jgi:hypothetical protein
LCQSPSVFLFLHLSVYPALCYSISPSLSFLELSILKIPQPIN